jgi:hypothetical protein
MRQQPLCQRNLARFSNVIESRLAAECGQFTCIPRVNPLRLVAETQECFGASPRTPRAQALADLLPRHRPGTRIIGIFPEGTVGTAVPTQVGDREKDFWRIGDDVPFASSADFRGSREELATRRNRESYECVGFFPAKALSRKDGPQEVSNRARGLRRAISTLGQRRKHRTL